MSLMWTIVGYAWEAIAIGFIALVGLAIAFAPQGAPVSDMVYVVDNQPWPPTPAGMQMTDDQVMDALTWRPARPEDTPGQLQPGEDDITPAQQAHLDLAAELAEDARREHHRELEAE